MDEQYFWTIVLPISTALDAFQPGAQEDGD